MIDIVKSGFNNHLCQVFIKDTNGKTHLMVINENTMPFDCLVFIDDRMDIHNAIMKHIDLGKIKYQIIYQSRPLNKFVPLIEQNVGEASTLYLKIYPLHD